jgi:hypothetical protein
MAGNQRPSHIMSFHITSHRWLVTLGHADQLSLKTVGRWSLTSWGAIGLFLAQDTAVFGNIAHLLDEEFARDQTLLCWLAVVCQQVKLEE